METLINFLVIFCVINLVIFIFLIYQVVRYGKKESKLNVAIDHYTIVNDTEAVKKDHVSDTIDYTQTFEKSMELIKLVTGDRKNHYIKQFREETAREIGLRLLRNGALDIKFIDGEDADFIEASISYLIKV